MTIDAWIKEGAVAHPDKSALIYDGHTITYGAMADQIAVRARHLTAFGIKRGDRVAWYGTNHPEVFILLFACARLGAILVPLNWRLAEAEVATIVANCSPRLVIHDAGFAEAAQRLRGPVVRPVDAPFDRQADVAGGATRDDPLLLVYTSGSTGKPKGVVLAQKALVANAKMSVEAHAMTPDDTVLNVLPLFHVGGLNILPTPAFSIGATVELHERFDPDAAAQALTRCTLAIVVPTVMQAIMSTDIWATGDFHRLRAIAIGSTDVPRDLLEACHARGIPMVQIYGATETCPLAIYQTAADAIASTGSIGRVGSACEVRLVQPDGTDAPQGQPGEICVRGDNILHHYWRDPALTAEMLRDGWFHTGDVAVQDEDGLFWFTDRIKHIIISGGENIHPAEIERALRDLPGLHEVAVVGQPDPKWGEIPVAVVVGDRPLPHDLIRAHLDGRIARYKLPRRTVQVNALPRNPMGKVVAAQVRHLIRDARHS